MVGRHGDNPRVSRLRLSGGEIRRYDDQLNNPKGIAVHPRTHRAGAYPGGCFGCLSTPISRSTGLSLILPLAREEANHIEPVLAIATNTPR